MPEAKISVLSNSTKIDKDSVLNALKKVDNNILKLDSVFNETVNIIDKPVNENFDINKTIDLLCKFDGNLIIQTMFLRGEHNGIKIDNTVEKEVSAWIDALKRIKPKQVMIYSLDRPTPEKNLVKVEREELERIAERVRKEGFDVTVA